MKVYQVKEWTDHTKEITEYINKKYPDLNIPESLVRETLIQFSTNLREAIIKTNQHPPQHKAIFPLIPDPFTYHIQLQAGENKGNLKYNRYIYIQLFPQTYIYHK